jgi:hypothetical protein
MGVNVAPATMAVLEVSANAPNHVVPCRDLSACPHHMHHYHMQQTGRYPSQTMLLR